MKLFVTGGTGFVGSHFIDKALKNNYEVIALKRTEYSLPRISLNSEPEWVLSSMDDDLSKYLSDCDVLVHLAAHTPNPPYASLDECMYWNVTASLQLLEQAYEAGIKYFLIAGSCFEYGRSGERYKYIPVDAPLEPTMTYPTSKAAASVAFHGWAIDRGVSLQILRIFQVFGEGEPSNRLWPSLRRSALAGDDFPMTWGEQVRDFISVEEVSRFFVEALKFENVRPYHPIIRHVGTGFPQTVRLFSEYWWEYWGATGKLRLGEVPYRENEVMRFVPDI